MDASITKNPDFVFHQKVPPNGGPPLSRLVEEFVTSESDFFLRTHGGIPELDPSSHRLSIRGLVEQMSHR
jgi:sulfite oxidase